MPDKVVEFAEAELSHQFAHLFGNQRHIIHQELWTPGKLGRPQILALCRNARRTGVEMTLTRHITAQRDQHRRAEAELFSTEQSSDNHIASGLEASIDAHAHPLTQTVLYKHL